jgi:mono/diheme cytochrome c family protein
MRILLSTRTILSVVFCAVMIGFAAGADAPNGKELFTANCAPCHGPDGKAKTPAARKLGVKDLTQSKLADAEIKKQIVEGRKDKKGNQQMPAFEDKLSAEQIAAIIAVVKEFRKK